MTLRLRIKAGDIPAIALLLFISYICLLYLLRPIHDPDFFWHIATGRWIFEHRALPHHDPFSYTTPAMLSDREIFLLTSYWLSQLIYYLSYLSAGWPGILLLRLPLLFFTLYFIYKRMRGVDLITSLSLLLLSAVVLLQSYPLDRPQVFSFMFFSILIYLMERIRDGSKKPIHLYSIPIIMVIWANMHGGFILGQGILLVYLITELIKLLHPSLIPAQRDVLRRLIPACLLGIIAGFINPNAIRVFNVIEVNSPARQSILEFKSTLNVFLSLMQAQIPLYWLLLLLTILSTLRDLLRKRLDITSLILLTGLGYFSFMHIRYVAFFMIWAPPIAGGMLSSIRSRIPRPLTTALIITGSIIVLMRSGEAVNIKNLTTFRRGHFISNYYPEYAVRFIRQAGLKPRMYNYYDWGGYLIWRLYPEKAVFIDGRQLYDDIYLQARSVDKGVRRPEILGRPFWRATLDTYGINYILLPIFGVRGNVLPIIGELLRDDDWVPVFFKGNSLIFIRRIKDHYPVIYRFSIPKDYFINDLIAQIDRMLRAGSGHHVSLYIAKGDLLLGAGRVEEAKKVYRDVLDRFPLNSTARRKLEILDSIGEITH